MTACRYGERACPSTTLYLDFLMRHEVTLTKKPRIALQVKNLARIKSTQDMALRAAGVSPLRG